MDKKHCSSCGTEIKNKAEEPIKVEVKAKVMVPYYIYCPGCKANCWYHTKEELTKLLEKDTLSCYLCDTVFDFKGFEEEYSTSNEIITILKTGNYLVKGKPMFLKEGDTINWMK